MGASAPMPDLSPSSEDAADRWPALGRELRQNAPLYLMLVVLLLLGLYLRLHDMPGGTSLRWDEHHYVRVAAATSARRYDTTLHPPLGPLFIAAAIELCGDRPLGWRLASMLFGFLNVVLIAWVTRIVFKSWRAAPIAAAFVAADGFFVAYSRVALIDGMVVAFGMAGIATMLTARNGWRVLLAGLLRRLGVDQAERDPLPRGRAGDLSDPAPAALVCAALGDRRGAGVLRADGVPPDPDRRLRHPRGGDRRAPEAAARPPLAHGRQSVSSRWYTWFLPWRPIFLRRDLDAISGSLNTLITLGNPLLWWGSTVAVLIVALFLVRVGRRRLWRQLQDGAPPSVEATPEARPSVRRGPRRAGRPAH